MKQEVAEELIDTLIEKTESGALVWERSSWRHSQFKTTTGLRDYFVDTVNDDYFDPQKNYYELSVRIRGHEWLRPFLLLLPNAFSERVSVSGGCHWISVFMEDEEGIGRLCELVRDIVRSEELRILKRREEERREEKKQEVAMLAEARRALQSL